LLAVLHLLLFSYLNQLEQLFVTLVGDFKTFKP